MEGYLQNKKEIKHDYKKDSCFTAFILALCLHSRLHRKGVSTELVRFFIRDHVPTDEGVFAEFGSFTYLPSLSADGRFEAAQSMENHKSDLVDIESIVPDIEITGIREDLSGLNDDLVGERKVSFLCNGHPYSFTLVGMRRETDG